MVIIFLKTRLHGGFKVYSDSAGASLKDNPVNYSEPSFMDQTCIVKTGSRAGLARNLIYHRGISVLLLNSRSLKTTSFTDFWTELGV